MMNMGEGHQQGVFMSWWKMGNQMDKDDAAGRKKRRVKVHLLRRLTAEESPGLVEEL